MSLFSITIPPKPIFDETIKEILGRPEYKHLTGGLGDFIERMKDMIGEWLEKILKKTFSNLANAPAISDKLATIFMIIGLLIIIAIIVLVIIRISKTFDKKARVGEILGEKITDRVTPNSLRSRGAGFTKQGDFRQAIRYDFIAVLLLMHEKNILYLDETKTGEEIYNYLKRNKFEMVTVFKKLVNMFNASWYGHKASDQELYDEWNSTIEIIWNEVISYEEKNQ
ncbi:MAG: hypothetical protein K0R09_139 [Clostridiales bacterium]|nr:hypothetical protein [Clostridiales bacterium]